jgi:phenol/toluene 2-monooxygenase (NADH) P4/A4
MKPAADRVENFGGNQVVYIQWQKHLSFCAAMAFPLPPAMPFGALVGELMPQFYSMHPDWKIIDWAAVQWTLDGEAFTPDLGKSLADNHVGHKSLIGFTTPGLDGFSHSSS